MKRRAFLRHAAAAIATVAIGIKLQSPLPIPRDGLVPWKSWHISEKLNGDRWHVRAGEMDHVLDAMRCVEIVSGPPGYGPVAVTRNERGKVIRVVAA